MVMVEKNEKARERKDKDKKHRSSRSKRSHKVPKSVRWQKNLTSTSPASNGIKKLSCSSFNCTEKLSSILMCQKGYASIALYAVFALFILAFIYTLWKIVSANTSRSGQSRRPDSPTKASPTAKAPTWSEEDEEELKKFFPVVVDAPTRGIEKHSKGSEGPPTVTINPTALSPSLEHFPTESVLQTVSRLKGSVFGEDVSSQPYQENHQPPIIGEDYMPVNPPYDPKWPPINIPPPPPPLPWQSFIGRQLPWTLRQRRPQASLMRDGRLQGQFDQRGKFSYRKMKSKLQKTNEMPQPPTNAKYNFRDNGNSEVRNEQRANRHKKSKKHHDHFSNHHHHPEHHQSESQHNDAVLVRNENQRNFDELQLGIPIHHKKNYARDFILRPQRTRHQHNDYSNDAQYYDAEETPNDRSDNEDDSNQHDHGHQSSHLHHRVEKHGKHHHHHHRKPTEPRHHHPHLHHHTQHEQEEHHQKHTSNIDNAEHHHPNRHHHHQEDNDSHHRHHSNQHHHHEHIDSQIAHQIHSQHHIDHHHNKQNHYQHHNHHETHQQHHHLKHGNPHQHHHHDQKSDEAGNSDDDDDKNDIRHKIPHHVRHEHKEKHSHRKHGHKEDKDATKSKNVKRLHHIMDLKHYLKYKKHHSVDEEVHGQWKGIKKKIKVCTKLKRFSANGKVLLTRTLYRGRYLYTVLVCNVVHIRKHSKHRTHSTYKKTQLCYKLYFVTTATLQLNKKNSETGDPAEFEVNACRPSQVHYHSVAFRGALAKEISLLRKKNRDQVHRDDVPSPSREKQHKKKTGRRQKRKKKKIIKKSKTKKQSSKRGHHSKSEHHSNRENHSTKHKSKRVKVERGNRHSKNSEDTFFNKLLNVLSIVNKNKGTGNTTTSLSNLKTALQKMKKGKEKALKKKKKKHSKLSKKHTKKHKKKTKEIDISSPSYINKLLSKILPAVVNNVKNEITGKNKVQNVHATTAPTTKQTTTVSTTTPTTHTTTTRTTTTPPPTTPTTKTTTRPTTKAKGIEDELNDVLPLLLKKMHLAQQTTTPKPTTKPTTQDKSKAISDLLARLGLSGPPSKPTRDVKSEAKSSHSNPTIAEKLDDLTLPPLPAPPASPINKPSNKQSFTALDPYAKHILCFGDSLTNGYYNHGRNYHPYSIKLKQLMNSNSQTRYDILTSGKTGEMAHESMNHRLPQVLGNSSRFDWAIILAGTNDVAHVKNFGDDDSFMNQLISIWAPKIFKDIINLHEDAYRYGSRTVLLTIPESAYESWPQFKVLWIMRKRINQQLRQFAAQSQGRTILCDLAVQIPRHSLSPQLQKLFWSDHLHLTPLGYDKMAEVVYKCLKPYLQ